MTSTNVRLTEMTNLTSIRETTTTNDPQGAYQRLRDRYGPVAPVELEPGIPAWLVMGYPEMLQLVRNERLFSQDPNNWRLFSAGMVPPDSGVGVMMFPRDNLYFFDGDLHRRLRVPVDEAIATIDAHRMRQLIQTRCLEQIGQFSTRGTADLISEYAALIPMHVLTDLFGLTPEQGREFLAALLAIVGSNDDAHDASRRVDETLLAVMQAHRSSPVNDLTTVFLRHPNLRTDSEIQQHMMAMITAGWETTTNWIAQTLRLMLTDPRFAGRLRSGRLGVDDALNEVLWRDPPMANMPARYALADTILGGQNISHGDAVILGIGAANSDPRVRPADLWLEVDNRSHLSWSAGPHACPAQRPSRLIARVAVETALHRLHNVRLAISNDEIELAPSPWARCPASLPVAFSSTSSSASALAPTEGAAR